MEIRLSDLCIDEHLLWKEAKMNEVKSYLVQVLVTLIFSLFFLDLFEKKQSKWDGIVEGMEKTSDTLP